MGITEHPGLASSLSLSACTTVCLGVASHAVVQQLQASSVVGTQSTIATLAHELPHGSAVLVWGAGEQDQQLTELANGDHGWLRCGAEATPNDVAALIHMLLGE